MNGSLILMLDCKRGEDIEGIGRGEEFDQNVFNAKIILNNRNIVKR